MQTRMHSENVSATPLDYIMILLAVIMWGGSFAGVKYALKEATPLLIIWLRLVIAAPVMLIGMKLGNCMRLPKKEEVLPLVLMGVQGILFQQGVQAYAMRTASAANANWLLASSPGFVALFSWIFLKERISPRGVTGLILSAVGVSIVLALGSEKGSSTFSVTTGDVIIFLSVLNWAAYLIFSRLYLKADMPSGFVIAWEMLFSMLVGIPMILISGSDVSVIPHFSIQTWTALILLGTGCSAIAYFFWFHALSVLPVSNVAVFQFIQPFAGVFFAYYVVDERFTPWLFVGGIAIIVGIWLVNKK